MAKYCLSVDTPIITCQKNKSLFCDTIWKKIWCTYIKHKQSLGPERKKKSVGPDNSWISRIDSVGLWPLWFSTCVETSMKELGSRK